MSEPSIACSQRRYCCHDLRSHGTVRPPTPALGSDADLPCLPACVTAGTHVPCLPYASLAGILLDGARREEGAASVSARRGTHGSRTDNGAGFARGTRGAGVLRLLMVHWCATLHVGYLLLLL